MGRYILNRRQVDTVCLILLLLVYALVFTTVPAIRSS